MPLRSGRYETLRVIASGGMATVYLARAHGAGGFQRLVALKVMHPHIASEPEFVDMFLDEARLAARIHHPNVVGTSDVQQDESGLFLVMDYIEGAALQLILKALWCRGENLRLDVTLRIFLDALAGLHAAHELTDSDGQPLHLVHRDVSPQNILVGTDGIARLTDFGVARARSRLASTHGGQLKGKLTYMAPEQVRSEPVDRRTDIYAAGVMLWEMVAGQRLLRGDSDASIVQSILDGVTRSPREIAPSVPEPIADVCMRALRFEPEERYATAAAFAEALEGAADAANVHIAAPRAVATYVKELDLHSPPADQRVSRIDAPTLPASLEERSLTHEQEELAGSSSQLPGARRASEAALVGAEWGTRRAIVGTILALGAGIVAVVVVAIWLFASRESQAPGPAPMLSATGGMPLEPPSVVVVPSEPWESAESAVPSAPPPPPPPPSARDRASESFPRPSPGKAAPRSTTFRPSEL